MTFATFYRPNSPFVRRDRLARAQARDDAGPFDLVKVDDDRYRITLPVTGFAENELEVTTEDGELVVHGRPAPAADGETVLHRGITKRPFRRRFALAEHVRVDAAHLADGLLAIDLVREVPERQRPKTIAIDKAA